MIKLLYICTHNRCRSILSEAITNHFGDGILEARSAGSQPSGVVHPLSLKYLQEAGIPTENLMSQSWNAFQEYSPNIVVTVCDSAAKEECPVWFNNTLQVHWGLSDPSKLSGGEEEIATAFRNTISDIQKRVKVLKSLSLDTLSHEDQIQALKKIGAEVKN